MDLRDGYVLAQPRLTLSAVSPDTLGKGRSRLDVGLDLAATFAGAIREQGVPPSQRDPLADANAHSVSVTWTHGVRDDLDLGVRFAVHERGGGFIDPLIDEFHQATGAGETGFAHAEYDVSGPTDDGGIFDWENQGGGLADLEVQAKWRVRDGGRDGWSAALVGRATLPTGTGAYAVGGFSAGIEAAVAKRLAAHLDLFAGVGGTAWTQDEIDGVEYETFRGFGFAALEWRPVRWGSLVLEGEIASALVANVAEFSGSHPYWGVSARIDLSPCTELVLGFAENPAEFSSTADFVLHTGVTIRF